MVKRSELRSADEIHQDRYARDPEYAREHERTRLADEVAVAVLRHRVDKDLSQAELAERLGLAESDVMRLEDGQHTPSVETLERLAAARILTVEIGPEDGAHIHPWAV